MSSPATAPTTDGSDFSPPLRFNDVVRLAVKHAFWIVLFAVTAPVVVWFWTARQPKVYEASTTIVFDFSQSRALGNKVDVYDPYGDYLDRQQRIETEFRIMTSMRVAKQVVIDAGLTTDRAFLADAFPGAQPGKLSVEQLAGAVMSRIKTEPVRGTYLAHVTFESGNPAVAQRLVAAVVETYIRVSTEDTVGASGAALEWLTDQLTRLQQDVENSEMALHDFKLKRNLLSVSLNDQSSMLREEIQALNSAVVNANIKRASLLARANALAKVTHSSPDDVPASELLADKELMDARTQYLQARGKLAELTAAGKMSSHPDVVAAQTKLDLALDAYIHQVRNLQSAALRDASVVGQELASLSGLAESAKKRALELNLQEIEYKRLNRAASTNEKLYSNILERMKEVDLSRMVNTKTVKILDAPQLPTVPIRPKAAANVAVGAGIGVLLGIALALVRELTDRTVKTPADLETKLGLTSLGILPDAISKGARRDPYIRRKRKAIVQGEVAPELLVHAQPNSSMAEAARSIRSNILFMSPDNPPRVLLVTSASASEGKTTTAVTLATIFAQTGARVLLVDLDLRRPRIHRVFGGGSAQGITTVLLGDPLEEVIRETEVPNLSVLAAGPVPPNPAELLMSDRLSELLKTLGKRFDRVIIDSPPVNPITDAAVLATRVDGVVMVAWAHRTTVDQMRHASRSIRDVKGHILGTILNAVDLNRADYKYSYYYYRNPYETTEKDAEAAA